MSTWKSKLKLIELPMEVNILVGVVNILLLIALGLALFPLLEKLIRTLRAVNGRAFFYVRLKAACARKGLNVKKRHALSRSLFNTYDGSDIVIYRDGKELFHLKFFPYFIRGKINVLNKNGVLEMIPKWIMRNRLFTPSFPNTDTISKNGCAPFESRIKHRTPKLGFDASEASNVLLLPSKHCILRFYTDNRMQAADNSVEFLNGARFYDRKAFLKKLKEL